MTASTEMGSLYGLMVSLTMAVGKMENSMVLDTSLTRKKDSRKKVNGKMAKESNG